MNWIDQVFVLAKKVCLDFTALFLPGWMIVLESVLISITALCILGPVTMMYLTLMERKAVARMQNRLGPNRVGKWGLLQPIADGIKMFTKEDIVPHRADPVLHLIAPIIIVVPALLIFSVMPFGRNMTPVNLNIGVLFFIAVSSFTTIPIFVGSWASRNKYSLLGGMRSIAQMISYEVPLVLSIVPVILVVGTLSTNSIVEAQSGWFGLKWFVFTPWGFLAFIIFFLCSVAECNRCPFDLPEAESEIVAGFHTEYSGMKFALFYMAEFMNTFTLAGLAATLFLGGWQGPLLPSWLWFMIKTYALIFVMMWFRGTLPRLRGDQLMALAWKFFLPLTFVNILVAGFWCFSSLPVKIAGSVIILVLSFALFTRLNRRLCPEKREYLFGE